MLQMQQAGRLETSCGACRCLQTQHYRAALPVLEAMPEYVDPPKTGMTATAFLLFCYYGALIHIGSFRQLLGAHLQAARCAVHRV